MSGSVHAFLPSIEVDVGQEIFLPNDPWSLIKSGEIADVPLIAGMNLDEEATMAASNELIINDIIIFIMLQKLLYYIIIELIIGYIKDAEIMNNQFENFIPVDLNATDTERKQFGQEIRNFYFDGKALTSDTLEQFTKVIEQII